MNERHQCLHEHFDMDQPMGNGYIRCADCGRGVPVERAMLSLDKRIRRLEKLFRVHMTGEVAKVDEV